VLLKQPRTDRPIKKAGLVAGVRVVVHIGGFPTFVGRHNRPSVLVDYIGDTEPLAEPFRHQSGGAKAGNIHMVVGLAGDGIGDFDGVVVVGHFGVPLSFDGLSVAQVRRFVNRFLKKNFLRKPNVINAV